MAIIPLEEARKNLTVTPFKRWQFRPHEDRNALAAAMRLYNPLFSVDKVARSLFTFPNADYDPWQDVPEELKGSGFLSSYINANSKEDVERITAEIRQELLDRETMEQSGIKGFLYSILAAGTDPTQYLIPLSSLMKATKGAGIIKRAGVFSLQGMLSNVPTEMALQAGIHTRTAGESVLDTLAAGIFTGVLGGVTGLPKGVASEHIDELKTVMQPDRRAVTMEDILSDIARASPRRPVTIDDIVSGAVRAIEETPEGQLVPRGTDVTALKRSAQLIEQDIAILEQRLPNLEGENLRFIEERIANKRAELESVRFDIADISKGSEGIIIDPNTGLPTTIRPVHARRAMSAEDLVSGEIPRRPITLEELVPGISRIIPEERIVQLEDLLSKAVEKRKATFGDLVPDITQFLPHRIVKMEDLIPRVRNALNIEPRQTYGIEVYGGRLKQLRERYKSWKTIFSFPGKLVKDTDARYLGRLLPWNDSNPPVRFDSELRDNLTLNTIGRLNRIENSIDEQIKVFQKAAADAEYYSKTLDARRRAGAIRRARNAATRIARFEEQIAAELEAARMTEGFNDYLNSVKVQRDGYEYYIPREIIESQGKIQTPDGLRSLTDEISEGEIVSLKEFEAIIEPHSENLKWQKGFPKEDLNFNEDNFPIHLLDEPTFQPRNMQNLKKVFNKHIKMHPREWLEQKIFSSAIREAHDSFGRTDIKISMHSFTENTLNVSFDATFGRIEKGSSNATEQKITINRKFNFANNEVEHQYFKLSSGLQGTGIGKRIMRDMFEEYQRLGIEMVEVGANIDVGGYAWARYGFKLVDDDLLMDDFINGHLGLRDRAELLLLDDTIKWEVEEKEFLEKILAEGSSIGNHDRDILKGEMIWGISDMKTKIKGKKVGDRFFVESVLGTGAPGEIISMPIGKYLLKDAKWHGIFDFKDVDQIMRFNEYVGKER